MKKNLSYLLLFVLVVAQACSKDDEEDPAQAVRDLIQQQDTQIKNYLTENSIEAEKDEFGVYWVVLEENPTGQEIKEGNVADVTYRLTQLDGTLIGENAGDSARIARDKMGYFFPRYLSDALTFMREGEKYRFYMPFNVAFGSFEVKDVLPSRSIVVMDLEVKNVYTTAAEIKEADINMIERVVSAKEWDADTLANGVRKVLLEEGTGELPATGDQVSVRYTGSYLDGAVFDTNTAANDAPFKVTIGSGGTITGFQTAVKSMKEGEKAVFYLPSSEAYGKAIIFAIPDVVREAISKDPSVRQQFGSNASLLPIPPHAPMVFEIEVVSITKK